MHSSYTRRRIKALSDRGRKMAEARWKLDRERREAEMPARIRELAEIETLNYPRNQDDPIGSIQWHDFRSGRIHRWTIRIGDRIDRVTLQSPDGRSTQSHGWTWVMNHLSGFLAGTKLS